MSDNQSLPPHIKTSDIKDLLTRFTLKSYSSKQEDSQDEHVIDCVVAMWQLDYKCGIIENKGGNLCSTYPSKIIIPEYENGPPVFKCPLAESVIKSTQSEEEKLSSVQTSFNCGAGTTTFSSIDTEFVSDKLEKQEQILRHGSETRTAFSSPVAGFTCDDSAQDKQTSCHCEAGTTTFSTPVAGFTSDNTDAQDTISDNKELKINLIEFIDSAKQARCRYRFPVPAILCRGKYISRSATISCLLDVLGKNVLHTPSENQRELKEVVTWYMQSPFYDVNRARSSDIKLLKAIGTSSIIDLMVENKKVKYGFNVSSSEKADKENRYWEFKISSLPYPGCEFFKEFSDRKFNSDKLSYNWNPPFNDATLSLPHEDIPSKVTSDWPNYKMWDLRTLTHNYLKLILGYITDNDSAETGILIHCISGWDRTPLFISLLRLILWADGHVHSSLNTYQILFFTLAYDWYLFGHQLPDRLKYGENILYFCFEFLEIIYRDADLDVRDRHPSSGSANSDVLDNIAGGTDTPSSFGSTTSLASSSSSNPSHITPSLGPSPTIKVSPLKQTTKGETSNWPFARDKENDGFTFDGISENESPGGLKVEKEGIGDDTQNNSNMLKKVSPGRSPLKERNKGTPIRRMRKVSGDETASNIASSSTNVTSDTWSSTLKAGGGMVRKPNLNGFLRDLPGRRSRKNSSTESPAKYTAATNSVEFDTLEYSDAEQVSGSGISPLNSRQASNPVPVPGGRSRHSSTSSIGSWQFVNSEPLRDTFGTSFDSYRSSRTSLTAEMVDSTNTIKEETTPSSSLDSSIIIFNRRTRLAEVRELFYTTYGEITSMQEPNSFFNDVVSSIW